jgi:hypothetical protein
MVRYQIYGKKVNESAHGYNTADSFAAPFDNAGLMTALLANAT